MRHKRILNLAIASALGLLAPVSAHAFGLGKINVESALNEPFNAEIPVTALKAGEAQNLQVRLASNEEFEKAGIERHFILSDFTFDIVKNSATDVVIKVSSSKSVREPLVDFLLTASAGNGRLIREYTVLLDPPTHVMAEPEPVSTMSSVPTQDIKRESVAVEQQTVSTVAASSQQNSNNKYGVTTSADTLWNIAKKVRPSADISMNQMMVALFNENTKAFRNQNINGLKTGYAITIPSLTSINSISKQEANQAVREHNEQWKNRSRSVSSAEVLVANEAVNSNQQDLTQEPASDEQLASPFIGNSSDSDAEAKLSLVTPSQGDDITDETSSELGDESIKTISEQLTFAQETIEAQAQQNIEIESRMAAMEEQLETMRRLISLKDADLARLQSLLEEEQTDDESLGEQVESVVDAVVDGSQEVAEDIEAVIDEINAEVEEQPDTATERVQNETSSTEDVVDTVDDIDSGSEQEISTLINPEPTEESNDLIDTVSNLTGSDQKEVKALIQQVTEFATNNKIPLSLAGILLLVILLLLFRRKKTDENEEESEPEIIVAPAIEDEQDETLDEVSDENVGANTSQAPTKTAADLIDQADVFVGYADYAQARTSLEQARFIEPENTQAVSKLLFVLFKQQQTDKFIQLIEDAGVDSTHNDWQQIKEWGAELAPTNELFGDVTVNNDQLGAEIHSQQDEATDLVQEDTSVTIEESVTSEQEDSYIDFNADEYQVDQDLTNDEDSLEISGTQEQDSVDSNIDIDDDNIEFEYTSGNEVSGSEELSLDELTSLETDIETNDELNIESLSVGSDSTDQDVFDIDKVEANDLPDLSLDIETQDLDNTDYELDINNSEDTDTVSTELSLDDSLTLEIDKLDVDDDLTLNIDSADNNIDSELDFDSSDFASSGGELEFDLDNFDEIDEAETKLDLAVAYIDMGDPDGAKSILDEVIADGNDEQKSRAQDLLASLA